MEHVVEVEGSRSRLVERRPVGREGVGTVSRPSSRWSVRTSLSAALSLAVLFGGPAIGASSDLPSAPFEPQLAEALSSGQSVDVIVTGPRHVGLAEQAFATRADAREALEAAAAPFFASVDAVVGAAGGEVVARFFSLPGVTVRGGQATVEALSAVAGVTSLSLDRDNSLRLVDPLPSGPEVANSEGRNMLEAEEIWALGFRGEGVKVSVIDTGLDPTHEALRYADGSSRVEAFVDYVNNQSAPYDDHGHGTHVAGTALGSNDYVDPNFGAFQEVGVAPEASLMGAKFLSSAGGGSTTNGILSLEWSFDQGADLTSNSWGSSGCSSANNVMIQTISNLTDLGMPSVFAAGNSGPGSGSVGAPACAEAAISVGAVDGNGAVAVFSSRGACSDPWTGTGSRICPDLVAKGVAVRSAIPRSGATNADPTGYKTWQGTSMATPHVAGAVALIEQMKRHFTGTGWDSAARAEEEVLKLAALDLGPEGPDNTYGWGLPKLTTVYAMLNATDEALIVDTFLISNAVLRQGDSTTLAFSVRNLGGATATGNFQATLTGPDGSVQTLKDVQASLGLLDRENVQHVLVVSGDVAPGTYTFNGSFAYSWTDGDGNVRDGLVLREGVFDVKRVFLDMSLEGLDPQALPGIPQPVVFAVTNTGNENASDVVIEFTVPDHYRFLPGSNFDPSNGLTLYADPAPNSVHEDQTFNRVTLRFVVGSLAQGDSWSFTATLAPTRLGVSRLLGVARFLDGAGRGFNQGRPFEQDVTLLP